MVTNGAQEAMTVILTGLFDAGKDALLASDPTYIGITGLARLLGIPVIPVPWDDEDNDSDWHALRGAIDQSRHLGVPHEPFISFLISTTRWATLFPFSLAIRYSTWHNNTAS